jgi:hypothetical protein
MIENDLGVLLELLQQEKATVLRSQLASISIDAGERQRISNVISSSLEQEVLEVSSTILNLTQHDQPDAYLKERVTLEEHRRTLTRELRAEQRDAWKDCQELRREQRMLELELVQSRQRRERLEDLTNAPGPV